MSVLRRSTLTLYSGPLDIHSHQIRIVLAEKGINVDILSVTPIEPCQDLIDLNPYNSLPTLVDRELVLYEPTVIMEYLDERFPHPPLLPVYPIARAKSRLMIFRIYRDWYSLLPEVFSNDPQTASAARDQLANSITTLAPVFAEMPYFLSEDFSLIDCTILPLLWRLPSMEVQLPRQAKGVIEYANRLFERESFQASLSESEQELPPL